MIPNKKTKTLFEMEDGTEELTQSDNADIGDIENDCIGTAFSYGINTNIAIVNKIIIHFFFISYYINFKIYKCFGFWGVL